MMYGSNCQNIILININTSLELMISRDTDMFNLINMFSRHPIMECRIFVSLYDKYRHTFQFRTAQKTMRKNPLNQTYFLLTPKSTAAAPNPARIPAAGAGVDVCCGGWLTGDAAGCAKVGSSPAGIGVGSVVAGSHTDAP